jgi:glyoxylase-like metal-dependent hydrolase (beta-lactamase superfamily II)
MNRYFSPLLLSLISLFPHFARAQDMHFKEVASGIFAYIGETGARTYENEGMNTNTGFIVTKAGVVVVDSGSSYQVAQKIHAAIRNVSKQPVKYVINTGGQDHRWLGNGYFKAQGAEIIAASAAIADMKARGAGQIEGMKGALKERFANTELTLPTRSFEQELVLKLGEREIHLLHYQPAHTPGDSVVWLPKEGVVFAGDLVYVDRLLGVFPFSSANGWLASLEAMAKLQPRVIIPGHGAVCDLPKAQQESAAYLRLLITQMGSAVEKGVDIQQAIDSLDQSAFSYLANYESLKGRNASGVYLEMESR